jgi:hypothetical protein
VAEKIYDYFETPKGTKLPLIDLKGKPYLKVPHRLVWFREERPEWTILTELVAYNDQSAIAKAVIKDETGRTIAEDFKQETKAGFPDFIEKSVTGAVGRALGLCGFGTQFAPEFDEEDRLADSPTERPRAAPIPDPSTIKNPSEFVVPFGRLQGSVLGGLKPEDLKAMYQSLNSLTDRNAEESLLLANLIALSRERASK